MIPGDLDSRHCPRRKIQAFVGGLLLCSTVLSSAAQTGPVYDLVAPPNVKPSSQVFCAKDTLYKQNPDGTIVVNVGPNITVSGGNPVCLNSSIISNQPASKRPALQLAEIRGWVQAPPYGPASPATWSDGEQEYKFFVGLDVG